MKKCSRPKVFLRVPPIARARSTTTSTQDTFIHTIELCSIFLRLQVLLPNDWWRFLRLKPWLNTLILIVEVRHIHHKVFHHIHVWKGRDKGVTVRVRINLGKTSEAITTIYIHCTRATYTLSAGASECEGRVDLILYLDQSV